ncbi:MAG: hypothetical protein HY717_07475 [Planctomycetes bacterium]|nr:hypothetical protein [Planctomycetota bacterium]
MSAIKGRLVALAAASAGLITLLGTGLASKDFLVEQWWLYRFGSGSDVEKRVAIAKLGERRSVRAIPRLIKLLGDSFDPDWPQGYLFQLPMECSEFGEWRLQKLMGRWPASLERAAVLALLRASEPAARAVEQALPDWDEARALRLAALLGVAAENERGSLDAQAARWFNPVLGKLAWYPDEKVQALAKWALEQFEKNLGPAVTASGRS